MHKREGNETTHQKRPAELAQESILFLLPHVVLMVSFPKHRGWATLRRVCNRRWVSPERPRVF